MKLALLGGAVSPVTSYLATEPGVRPSTEGLEEVEGVGEGGGGRGEGIGLGSIGTLGHGASFDPEAFLRGRLAAAWRECGGPPGTARLTLETTLVEVVDVKASVEAGPLRTCIEERAWELEPGAGFDQQWARWTVAL